jgi:hypothetical protein
MNCLTVSEEKHVGEAVESNALQMCFLKCLDLKAVTVSVIEKMNLQKDNEFPE